MIPKLWDSSGTERAFSDSASFFTVHFEEALPKKTLPGRVIDSMRSLLM